MSETASELILKPGVNPPASHPVSCALHGLAGLSSLQNLSWRSVTPWMGGKLESSLGISFPNFCWCTNSQQPGSLWDKEVHQEALLVPYLVLTCVGLAVTGHGRDWELGLPSSPRPPAMEFNHGGVRCVLILLGNHGDIECWGTASSGRP